MHTPSPTLRWTTAVALVLAAVTTVVSVPLTPDFSGPPADWLAAIAAEPAAGWSFHLFIAAQLFIAVGVVGVAAQISPRAPRLAFVAATLLVLSCFAHAVTGGVQVMLLHLAPRSDMHAVMGAAIGELFGSVQLVPYLMLGVAGLVLGMILLGVALLKARFGPRWLGAAPILFVVAEFGLSALSEWAFHVAGALFAVTFIGLALVTVRGGARTDQAARRDGAAPAGLRAATAR